MKKWAGSVRLDFTSTNKLPLGTTWYHMRNGVTRFSWIRFFSAWKNVLNLFHLTAPAQRSGLKILNVIAQLLYCNQSHSYQK